MKHISFSLAIAIFAASAAHAGIPASAWRLPRCARIEGDRLIVEVPPGDPDTTVETNAHCETEVDLAPLLAGGRGAVLSVRVRAENISNPDRRWNGVKAMLRYVGEDGLTYWPGAVLPLGSFDWREAKAHTSWLKGHPPPRGGRATLVLGLQGCTGRAEFDLSSLRLESEELGIPMVNEDYIVNYPAHSRPLKGFMLPGRDTTERDIADIAAMGATMARFQITRNWHKVDDNRDLPEYFAWLERRLDNLAEVLGWAAKYGLRICIDLHAVPGGKHGERPGQPIEMAMFTEDEYAEAFIEAWRLIATRFKGNPAIYGYDLVNEPTQQRPVKNNYWDLQRRAAEAVREIDPETPIVFAANLASRATAFAYLRPIEMDNVIYQAHCYLPNEFTHQGVNGNPSSTPNAPLTWPGRSQRTGEIWNKDYLRRVLQPVRDFQLRHHARIYVGEFSAAAWAEGAEKYLRDCIDLFEEYGWDWTYHAFREAPCWDVEKILPEGLAPNSSNNKQMIAAPADTPRKQALLDGFAR